jgi:hypothetical protein
MVLAVVRVLTDIQEMVKTAKMLMSVLKCSLVIPWPVARTCPQDTDVRLAHQAIPALG